ncbi:hypothetical protein ESOMN_v1c06060 [Williamsoniiplasma somnilux]|uniref:Uncharacterized protein n=1 Tax=Williamsoniiplasma somnilux TaxID=215578 RepID=A0A2K8P0M7_9MOLU|nr:hypothetical protein [Williamsoniiplasma somnilux]ATZ18988.1 hypothetical protein ESOMN_v1c06060 [Williamsoniiplasma somnilux]
MIKLLTLLGAVLTPAVGAAPIISTVQNHNILNQKGDKAVAESKNFFWNDRHIPEIALASSSPWDSNSPSVIKSLYTFDLGTTKPDYKTMSFVGVSSEGFFNWKNFGFHWTWPEKINFSLNDVTNKKIKSIDDNEFFTFSCIASTATSVVNKAYSHLFAQCDAIVNVGYTWYQENGHYYFQFLLWQGIELNGFDSNDQAFLYSNLGTQLHLE